jgi:hypothetical protein
MSLKAIAMPAALEPGPLVSRWRRRTVAKVDSMVISSQREDQPCDLGACVVDGVVDGEGQHGLVTCEIRRAVGVSGSHRRSPRASARACRRRWLSAWSARMRSLAMHSPSGSPTGTRRPAVRGRSPFNTSSHSSESSRCPRLASCRWVRRQRWRPTSRPEHDASTTPTPETGRLRSPAHDTHGQGRAECRHGHLGHGLARRVSGTGPATTVQLVGASARHLRQRARGPRQHARLLRPPHRCSPRCLGRPAGNGTARWRGVAVVRRREPACVPARGPDRCRGQRRTHVSGAHDKYIWWASAIASSQHGGMPYPHRFFTR